MGRARRTCRRFAYPSAFSIEYLRIYGYHRFPSWIWERGFHPFIYGRGDSRLTPRNSRLKNSNEHAFGTRDTHYYLNATLAFTEASTIVTPRLEQRSILLWNSIARHQLLSESNNPTTALLTPFTTHEHGRVKVRRHPQYVRKYA